MKSMSESQHLINRIKNIKLLIFDVDGVLTDGGLYRSDDGQESKRFNSQDGLGIRLLKSTGVATGIITGRTSKNVPYRAKELEIDHVYQGITQKAKTFEQLCEKLNLKAHQIAYMGDDIIDLPVMARAGLSLTVANAHPEVIKRSHWVSRYAGGQGAAREACELIMHHQGTWLEVLGRYLR